MAEGSPERESTGQSRALRLREPANRVDPRSVRLWRLRAVALMAPVLAVAAFAAVGWTDRVATTVVILVPLLVVATLYVVVMPLWRHRVHRWEVGEAAVFARSGWFAQEWRVAPMSRIQTVDTVRGPIHQWLGISTVTVTTASAAGSIEIEALDRRQAEELVERLTAATEAVRGDAT